MDMYDKFATERVPGFGVWSAIPYSVVVKEALRIGLDEDGLHELWYHVHELDQQWRDAIHNRKPSNEGTDSGGLSHSDSGGPVRRGKRKPKG